MSLFARIVNKAQSDQRLSRTARFDSDLASKQKHWADE